MGAAKSVTATFTLKKRTLAITRSGNADGVITGAGIDCGPGAAHSDCSETVDDGTDITLTAAPNPNADFAAFTGGGCSTSPCTVHVDADKSVDARFTLKRHSLAVAISGEGAGTVTSSPAGIACPSDCSESFDEGTAVTLTAHPDANASFDGFTGAGCSAGELTCVVTIGAANETVDAHFTAVRADQPGPETTITRVPINPRPKRTHFNFVSSDGASTFTCRLDNEAPETCTSPKVYRHLSRGRHSFSVFATDASGKADPTPATATFRVKRAGRRHN